MMREIKKIVIAGAGTMGSSMGQTFAKFGYDVVLYDIFPAALDKAKNLITLNQKTEVSEGIVTQAASHTPLRWSASSPPTSWWKPFWKRSM